MKLRIKISTYIRFRLPYDFDIPFLDLLSDRDAEIFEDKPLRWGYKQAE